MTLYQAPGCGGYWLLRLRSRDLEVPRLAPVLGKQTCAFLRVSRESHLKAHCVPAKMPNGLCLASVELPLVLEPVWEVENCFFPPKTPRQRHCSLAMVLHDGYFQCLFLSLDLSIGLLFVMVVQRKSKQIMLDKDLARVDLYFGRLFLCCFGEVIIRVPLKHSRAQPSGE